MNAMFMVIVYLLILTTSVFGSTQTTSTLNSETSNINASSPVQNECLKYTPQSCSGVCGQYFALWCSCDEYCLVYGRCCFDYESVCKEESEKSKQDHKNLMNVTIECDSDRPTLGNSVPQQIITSCSLTNASVQTVELCEEETRSSVVVSKVMSKRTELHYKNRYCMLCNGEDEDDIVYWSTMIGTNNRRQRPDSGHDISKLFENPIIIIPPPNSKEIMCFPSMISSCVPSATPKEQRLCSENVLTPIKFGQSLYKNTFCLQCNVILPPAGDMCFPVKRKDIFYSIQTQSYMFSIILNWKQKSESYSLLDSKMSLIQNVSCALDDNGNLKGCKVTKCVGTISVVKDKCQIASNNFGCIQYLFIINFTVPYESGREMTQEVERISSKLVKLAATFERMHNITKYYSQNVTLYNITIVDEQITGMIILNRMAYNLCFSTFRFISISSFYEYVVTNLAFNLTGSISTIRYVVDCYGWCNFMRNINDPNQLKLFFTRKTEMGIDSPSSVTKLTPISVYLVSLIWILLA